MTTLVIYRVGHLLFNLQILNAFHTLTFTNNIIIFLKQKIKLNIGVRIHLAVICEVARACAIAMVTGTMTEAEEYI